MSDETTDFSGLAPGLPCYPAAVLAAPLLQVVRQPLDSIEDNVAIQS